MAGELYPGLWWIEPGKVLGGPTPASFDTPTQESRLRALLDLGVTEVINLQMDHEPTRNGLALPAYQVRLQELAAQRGVALGWVRLPTRDMEPPTVETVREALRRIRGAAGVTFVHCRGGHGRTGVVAGCHLRERGLTAEQAFAAMAASREPDLLLRDLAAPQNEPQREVVRRWVPGS
jgi:protein tyrosine phosphatase (PTP) superfamily phosphohydrolase (DUF442 family)